MSELYKEPLLGKKDGLSKSTLEIIAGHLGPYRRPPRDKDWPWEIAHIGFGAFEVLSCD